MNNKFSLQFFFIIVFVNFNYVDSSTLDLVKCDKNGHCFCPADPLTERYPNPRDKTCRTYYLCHLTHAFYRECGVRTAFHPNLGECVSRKQIPEDVCKFPVACPKNMYISDPDDCNKYYLCFYHQPYHYACEINHVFDSKDQKCVYDKDKFDKCSSIPLSQPIEETPKKDAVLKPKPIVTTTKPIPTTTKPQLPTKPMNLTTMTTKKIT